MATQIAEVSLNLILTSVRIKHCIGFKARRLQHPINKSLKALELIVDQSFLFIFCFYTNRRDGRQLSEDALPYR
uniref:Uncharacterized protein n=1 Tax=Manihot esculenta TaxID=3983 RepID=A0A2C9WBH1_MANES